MKALKKFALISLIFPLFFSLSSFQTFNPGEEKEIVIIRIQEAQMGGMGASSHILISEKGKIRTVEIEKFGSVSSNTKILEVISGLINQYYKEGYKLENSSSVAGINAGITTYILIK